MVVHLEKGSLFKQNNYNSASNPIKLLRAQPRWFTLYKMKGRKRLAHDVKHSSAKFINRVHDLAYTECQTQNGSPHGHVFNCMQVVAYVRGLCPGPVRVSVVMNVLYHWHHC